MPHAVCVCVVVVVVWYDSMCVVDTYSAASVTFYDVSCATSKEQTRQMSVWPAFCD